MKSAMTPEVFKRLYLPSAREPVLVRVPKMRFLAVEGSGDPSTSREFQDGIGALYGTAYTMKFAQPKGHPVRDERVAPLEGLYWTPGKGTLDLNEKRKMDWRLMLRLPSGATARTAKAAMAELRDKKNPPALDRLGIFELAEGWSVQVMHVGPWEAEEPTIARLLEFARAAGWEPSGAHHEIYHSDPNRTKPENLKTVIRYPVRRAAQ